MVNICGLARAAGDICGLGEAAGEVGGLLEAAGDAGGLLEAKICVPREAEADISGLREVMG